MRRSCTETIFQIEESVLIGCSSVIETMDCKCLCNFTALSLHQIFSFFSFFFTNNRISSKLCMFLAHWYTHETSNFLTAFCYSGDDLTPLSYYVSLAESRADSQRKKEREGCTLFFFFLLKAIVKGPFTFTFLMNGSHRCIRVFICWQPTRCLSVLCCDLMLVSRNEVSANVDHGC